MVSLLNHVTLLRDMIFKLMFATHAFSHERIFVARESFHVWETFILKLHDPALHSLLQARVPSFVANLFLGRSRGPYWRLEALS